MREWTAPDVVKLARSGGLADSVFELAESDPLHVALARKDATGRWQDVTTVQFRDEVLATAKGLLAEGVRFGDRVAIMSRTRYEWTLLDYALWTIGAQPIPVYPNASSEQVAWVFSDAGVSAAVVEHEDHAMTVGAVMGQLPLLKRLWQLDAGAEQHLRKAGERIATEVVDRHRMALTPDTVATIAYTSGTDGRSRGCVLTHANFMAGCDNVAPFREPLLSSGHKQDDPATLLFLPLAHIHGRLAQVAALRAKVRLGHQPDLNPEVLLPDFASFRPTYVLALPHLFERILQSAWRIAENEGRADAFEKAVDVAVRYAEAVERRAFDEGPGPGPGLRLQQQVMDRAVYVRLREAFGGRMRYAVCGGFAMDRRTALFYDGAGIRVLEAYGLTEATSTVTASPADRVRFGTLGQPVPGTSVRIARDGEIWVRGGQVFAGYHNDPAGTALSLRDGWLATGDLGSLDEDGYLTLTGRKKDVLVTSSGRSISPCLLEDRIRRHPLVSQCVVVGNDRPFVGALITLDPEATEHWLALHRKERLALVDLVNDTDLEDEIRRAVVGANAQVSQAESVRTFRILGHQFTEAQGLLSPSLKLRRHAIAKAYEQEIDALYQR